MSLQVRNKTSGALERVAGYNDTDLTLSSTSKNPIANKTVYAALQQKIEKTVTDLVNYYDKSQTYNRAEVRALIGSINTLTIEVVSELPTTDISTTTIYFVGPKPGTNTYDEYVYVGSNWVQIGDTSIDLSGYVTSENLTATLQNYYTKSAVDSLLNDYYDKDEADDLFDTKQDKLTFDNTPISGSQNPVTSAGIKTALDNILISGNGGSIIKVHHLAGAAAQGNTVTASKGAYSVSSTFDASGDAIIIGFGDIGNIAITATNGSETGSVMLNIPSFSNYSVNIAYGLDYASWLIAGGVDPSYYESLDEVLEDEEVVRRLMTLHTSVDYLASITNANDEMAIAVLNNDICAKWINLRDYALDTLYANEYAKAIMDEADKYGYGEWALVGQVPRMTSATAPYGEVIYNSQYSGQEAWRAFDGSTSSAWEPGTPEIGTWIGYQFITPIIVKKIFAKVTAGTTGTITWQTQGHDGSDWVNIGEPFTISYDASATEIEIDINFNNDTPYSKLRIIKITQSPSFYSFVKELQFYAWQPKGNVPIMTSDTAPYGQVLSDGYEGSRYAWYAFDGNENTWWDNGSGKYTLGYAFTNPICSKRLKLYAGHLFNFDIEGSNDGTNWTKIGEGVSLAGSPITVDFSNSDYYLRYRINVTNLADFSIRELQFYGREMKVSVPAMTSDTAPYGEAINLINRHPSYSSYAAYLAMDKNTSTRWSAAASVSSADIGYDFTKPVVIKAFMHTAYGASIPYTAVLQGSDDKTTWINESEPYSGNILQQEMEVFDNTNAHRYWRILFTMSGAGMSLYEVNFFGFDYSERDWDIENPMHYIYDHGVELDEFIVNVTNASNASVTKTPNQLLYKTSAVTYTIAQTYKNIDLSDYDLVCINAGDSLYNSGGNTGGNIFGTIIVSNAILDGNYSGTLVNAGFNTGTGLPYKISANVSNINEAKYLSVVTGNKTAGQTRTMTINEWWLE